MTICALCDDPETPADHGMMCAYHRAQDREIYAMAVRDAPGEAHVWSDECGCVACRSDCVGIVPCEVMK